MRRSLLGLLIVSLVGAYGIPAHGDHHPHVGAGPGGTNPKDPAVILSGTTQVDGTIVSSPRPGGDQGPQREYMWLFSCAANHPSKPMAECANAHRCTREQELLWVLWGREVPDGTWIPLTSECRGGRPPDAPKPKLTPDRVLEAVRRIGLPSLQVRVQPDTATLVNFATIFYAEPQTFERTVSLLGFSVDVRAEPSSYRWMFGDGQEATTQSPGAPYPATDITHKYADAHVTVNPRVDVTYEVQYRVDGGAWQALDETLTAQGPATELRIKEATPVLSGGG